MVTVKHLLDGKDSKVWTVAPEATAYAALQLMADKNVGAVPVVGSGRVIGIFSERDYARKVILKGKSSRETAVRDLMTAEVYTVDPETGIEDCMALMTNRRIRHLPVLERQQLIGIISIGDVVKSIIEEQRGTIRELRDYVAGNMY
ncbi:MAG TPA: CBS domain-containing protein [Gammaproteobacteria bacterium]|nr:CBS domain-containing protein [Gammaproteobacteria bacterium]